MTTRRPRIGLVYRSGVNYAAFEILTDDGKVDGYAARDGDAFLWRPDADFTPLAELPEPRMDEPQERFATVVAKVVAQHPLDVFIRTHYGNWRRCLDDGEIGSGFYNWAELIDPRPTTPAERATGIVGGEDQ